MPCFPYPCAYYISAVAYPRWRCSGSPRSGPRRRRASSCPRSPTRRSRLRGYGPFLPEAFDSLLAVEPSVIRCRASISACEKGAQPGQALELLREMRRLCVEAAMCEAAMDEVAMDEAAMDEAAVGVCCPS